MCGAMDSNDDLDLKDAAGCGVKGVVVDPPGRAIAMFELDDKDK